MTGGSAGRIPSAGSIYQYMYMIQYQMSFFYPAVFVFSQSLENIPKVRPQLLIQRLPPTFRYEYDVVTCTPTYYGLGFRSRPSQFSFLRVLGSSQVEFR